MLGKLGFALGLRDFLVTNMLVSLTQKYRIGGIPNMRTQREGDCFAVEYRLKPLKYGII